MNESRRSSLALDRRGGVVVLQAGEESVTRENDEGRPESDSFDAAVLHRLLPSGKLDPSFGRKGEAVVTRGRPGFVPSEALVDGKNRILVAGAPTPNDSVEGAGSFLLARLSPEGEIDKRFGRRGWTQARWGEDAVVGRLSAAFVGGGKVLVAGVLSDPMLRHDAGVGLARFRTR